MKIVHVEWLDSVSIHGGETWSDKKDVAELVPSLCESVGFLVADTKTHVIVASHRGDSEISGEICIPRCAIKKMKVLRK